MKQTFFLLLIMSALPIFNSEVKAQYYTPYQQQQMNQQAYEWGANMARQMQKEYNNNPANAAAITGNALNTIGSAFMYDDPDQLYENAFEKLEHAANGLDFANASYWLGVFSECELVGWVDVSDAKSYYQDAADKGHPVAMQRLRELKNGATPYELDEVLTTLRQMLVAATVPSSIPSINGGSSSGSSTYSTCRICGGTGVCTTCNGKKGSWHDTGYYTGSGNHSWIDCGVCHGTGRCFNCHGTGRQ